MGVIQTRLTTIDMEKNKIEIYRSADGKVELNVKLEKDTVWLTQNQMAELFGVDRTSIVRPDFVIASPKNLRQRV